MLSTGSAAAVETLVERLRAEMMKLARENDDLRAENKRLAHENGELLDQLHDAREEAARTGAL